MNRLIDLDELTDIIESTTWYHIDDKGELTNGANSALHTPLFKAEDIFKALGEAKVVSREKLGRFIRESDVYKPFNPRGVAQLHVGDIDVLPRAEVKEVVHGRWIPSYKVNWWMGTQDIDGFTCNQCARHFKSKLRLNYCPHCGAKMDERG